MMGEIPGLITNHHNIFRAPKEKNTENALQQSHQNYKNLVDFVPEGIIIHKEGKIVFINKRGLSVFGFDNDNEVIGRSVMDFVKPEYRESVKPSFE
mgnify:CR=1 FL=1